MGYEQFVKHIFPFIGNKYDNENESKTPSKFVLTLDEIVTTLEQEDKVFIFNSKTGELLKAPAEFVEGMPDLENCHLAFSLMEGSADTIGDVACLYVKDMSDIENTEAGLCRIDELVEQQLPMEFQNLNAGESGAEFITVTTEDLELKEIKFSCPDDKTLVCEFAI